MEVRRRFLYIFIPCFLLVVVGVATPQKAPLEPLDKKNNYSVPFQEGEKLRYEVYW